MCVCVCARAHACARSCSAMSDSMTPWTVALQASLRGSPDPGIKPVSLASTALAGIFFTTSTPAAAAAKSLQSCPTLCDPIDSSPPGSSVPGILQARILESVAIAFSNAWKWKVKVKLLSRVRLFATPWTAAYQAPPPMGFSRQEYWSGVPLPSPLGKPYSPSRWRENHRHLVNVFNRVLYKISMKIPWTRQKHVEWVRENLEEFELNDIRVRWTHSRVYYHTQICVLMNYSQFPRKGNARCGLEILMVISAQC